jgi:hypothetical protein
MRALLEAFEAVEHSCSFGIEYIVGVRTAEVSNLIKCSQVIQLPFIFCLCCYVLLSQHLSLLLQ